MEKDWTLDSSLDCRDYPAGVTRTVYARFRDELHNMSDVARYDFVHDCTAPCEAGLALSLDGGAPYTRTVSVMVDVTCEGEMPVTMTVDCDGTESTVPYQSSFNCTLGGETGESSVTLEVQDVAGNESDEHEASIIFDDALPPSPELSPGVAANVNYSCALIQVPSLEQWTSGELDAGPSGFAHYEARANGSAWRRVDEGDLIDIGDEATIEFELSQDQSNLLEVRAVDNAGNRGQPAIATISESSSTLIPTYLEATHVCDHGRFVILREPYYWPATHVWWNDSHDGSIPEAALVQNLSEPRIAILDVENMTIHDFNGSNGLILPHGVSRNQQFENTVDVACGPDDPRVAFVYVQTHDLGGGQTEKSTRIGVWDDPLSDPLGLTIKNSGDWEEEIQWGFESSSWPLAINKIDVISWNSQADFEALVVTVHRDSAQHSIASLADSLVPGPAHRAHVPGADRRAGPRPPPQRHDTHRSNRGLERPKRHDTGRLQTNRRWVC